MDTSPPPAPPYGSLIEVARKGARLSMQRAAMIAGVSKATWIDNTRGYRRRGDAWEPVEPKPETVARMAHAVRLGPERLESEGQHLPAAVILREILRTPPEPAPAPGAAPADTPAGDPQDDAAARLFPGDTRHDRMIRNIWRLGEYGTTREDRINMIAVVDPGLAAALRDVGGQSEVGLTTSLQLRVHYHEPDTLRLSGSHRTVPVRHP